MTVLDNVMVGCHCRSRSGFLANALRLPGSRREEARDRRERADELLALLDLDAVSPTRRRPACRSAPASGSSWRARSPRSPKLLLLDEPAGGLNHEEVDGLAGLIQRVRDTPHVTVLLVEHHMSLVMSVSDKVVALDFGRKIAEGTPAEVQRDPR